MREFLIKILSLKEGATEISLFSMWHIFYIVLIIGGSVLVLMGVKILLEGLGVI